MVLRQLDGIVRDGNAEVGDLDRPVILHQYILRLDVPMDDMFFMCQRDGAGQLHHDVDRLIEVKRSALSDQLFERASPHILHDDVMSALAFADIVDIDDVGMGKLAGGAGLSLKAQQRHRIVRQLSTQDLDGDLPVQDRIDRLVNVSHPALPDIGNKQIAVCDQLIHLSHLPPYLQARHSRCHNHPYHLPAGSAVRPFLSGCGSCFEARP